VKRVILALSIFALSVALAVTSTHILTNCYNDINGRLNEVILLATDGSEQLPEENEKLMQSWEDSKQLINLFTNRKNVEDIGVSIYKMQGYLEKGDLSLYLGECYGVRSNLEHILKGDNITWEILT